MTLKVTTALRKILALTARIWGIQGGQGAGKTIALLWLIVDHAWKSEAQEIYIASAELSKMRDTVCKDFIKVVKSLGMYSQIELIGFESGRPKAIFPNGSFIRFLGLDKEDIGKGLRSDVMFINESNKINFETFRELTARAGRVILDFNPNNKFWYHKEVKTRKDCQHLVLTYLDNEHCPQNEVDEILSYKAKGIAPDGSVLNEYWANKWRVYGLGEEGGVEGRIFYWNQCSYLEYLKIDKQTYFGCDWGKSDPWAIGEAKYHDGVLYVHERNYLSENQWRERMTDTELRQAGAKGDGFGIISWMFDRLAIPRDGLIVCDNNPEKIISLREMGWEYAFAAVKGPGSINAGVDVLQNIDVVFTDQSENIEFEQENYCWAVDRDGEMIDGRPLDANNHHMDWIRYLASWLMLEGVIRAA